MPEFDPRAVTVNRKAPKVLLAIGGLTALLAAWKLTVGDAPSAPHAEAARLQALENQALAQAARPEPPRAVAVRVARGETLEQAVRRTGVGQEEARTIVQTLASAFDTVNIRAGLAFEALVARPQNGRPGQARLISLSMRTGPATQITLARTFDGALRVHTLQEQVTEETTVAQGEMEGSLYESAQRAGADTRTIANVVQLFAHRLDFSRDIQAGDHFRLVYDRTVTESGRTVETGDLRYAEIEANGQTIKFYRFEHDGRTEYFDERGTNIRGFLLRTPVDGARMTSTYGMRRHPVLGYTRMHQGIDFGAGMGTPILAAGDGVVLEARRWGGYGNWLRIRHSGGWDTGYGHLSRYATGLRPGMHVSQGQVVGYVGSTGVATGPHLHYEIWLNGARVNPISARVPQGIILAGAELRAFMAERERIDAMVEAATARHIAEANRLEHGSAAARLGLRGVEGIR